jgi:hypothetical protein
MSTARPAVGPFELHLREAIELNLARAPLYAELTQGASRPISRSLILYERLLLPVARWYDRRAWRYHAAGVPLLDELFVPMDRTPEWLGYRPPVPAWPALRPAGWTIGRQISDRFRRDGFAGAAAEIERQLEALDAEPSYHGMLRHLLESTLRIASLAPLHDRLARERGLPSPLHISTQLFRLHVWGCVSATRMDRRAVPLQARGVAIIVQDVPPIPSIPPI